MTNHYNVRANATYTEGRRDTERDISKATKKHIKQDPSFLLAIKDYVKPPRTAEQEEKAAQIRKRA